MRQVRCLSNVHCHTCADSRFRECNSEHNHVHACWQHNQVHACFTLLSKRRPRTIIKHQTWVGHEMNFPCRLKTMNETQIHMTAVLYGTSFFFWRRKRLFPDGKANEGTSVSCAAKQPMWTTPHHEQNSLNQSPDPCLKLRGNVLLDQKFHVSM